MKKLINAISIVLVTIMILINPIQAEATSASDNEIVYSDLKKSVVTVDNFQDLIDYSGYFADKFLAFDVQITATSDSDSDDTWCTGMVVLKAFVPSPGDVDTIYQYTYNQIFIFDSNENFTITGIPDDLELVNLEDLTRGDNVHVYGKYIGVFTSYKGEQIPAIALYLAHYI